MSRKTYIFFRLELIPPKGGVSIWILLLHFFRGYTNNDIKWTSVEFQSKTIELVFELFYMQSASNSVLQNVSFEVKAGELLIVIGSVGAGKVSLSLSLINALNLLYMRRSGNRNSLLI